MNNQTEERTLTTADLAAAADPAQRDLQHEPNVRVIERSDAAGGMEHASNDAASEMDSHSSGDRARAEHGGERMDGGAERAGRDMRSPGGDGAASRMDAGRGSGERLAALFAPEAAAQFRSRWIDVQSSFVDDPAQAVRQGDELVAQLMKTMAESFAAERTKIENQMGQDGKASTEDLRQALRRYRSFFERLLSL